MTRPASVRNKVCVYLGILFCAFQYAAIAVMSVRTSVNIPIEDDYDALFAFLNGYSRVPSLRERAMIVLTTQHTNYKLILLHTLLVAQYGLLGHVNLRVLELLGDATLLVSATLLWFFVRGPVTGRQRQLWTWVPACLFFLAPLYWRNINWPLCAVQNLSIVMFALATALCVRYRGALSAALLLAGIVLSVATSGNGFFIAIIVVGMLLLQRRFRLAAVASAVLAALIALYSIGYFTYAIAPPLSPLETLKAFVFFPFTFLGNAAAHPYPAVVLGIILVCIFVWLCTLQWYRLDPASFSAALFCIVTALGATVSRHRYGWEAGLTDRYSIYSVLLIALEIIGLAVVSDVRNDVFESSQPDPRAGFIRRFASNRAAVAVLVAAAVLFGLRADRTAYTRLKARHDLLIIHLIQWERNPSALTLVPDEESYMSTPDWLRLRAQFQEELSQSIALGLYIPPFRASDPLPARPKLAP